MNNQVRRVAGLLLALLVASVVVWVVLAQRVAEGPDVGRLQRDLGFEAEVRKTYFRDPVLVVTRVANGGVFSVAGVRPGFAFANTTNAAGVRDLYEYLESRRGRTATVVLIDFSNCVIDCVPVACIAKISVPWHKRRG